MAYIAKATPILATCLVALTLATYDVFIVKTENGLRCRKLCIYHAACNRFQFRMKRCVLVTHRASSYDISGVKVDKSGDSVSSVCGDDEVCIPTGIIAPGYRRESVLGINLVELKGFKIYIHVNGTSFDKAVQYCADQGGQLFVVGNQVQWQTIVASIVDGDVLVGTNLKGLWINANDRKCNGTYVTTSGKQMPFVEWKVPNEPSFYFSGLAEDCVEIRKYGSGDYKMNDAKCSEKRGFICEWIV